MFGCEGAEIVPIAQPFICNQFLHLKIKLFSVSINAKNVVITFAEAIRLEYFIKHALANLIPSAFGILVYNDFRSGEKGYEFSVNLVNLSKKVGCILDV